MTPTDNPEVADRHEFFDGQRLFANDLQGVERFHRTLRELHNRSLHQPGIGSGFEVTGERGDCIVVIGPGYAIDGNGHEILNTSRVTEAVPPVAADDAGEAVFFDLTVSYRCREQLEEAEVRRGVCADGGVVRRREEPLFCWIRLERGQDGQLHPADPSHASDLMECRKIRLARVEVKDCRLQSLLLGVRHSARPDLPAYLGSGEHPLKDLDFKAFVEKKEQLAEPVVKKILSETHDTLPEVVKQRFVDERGQVLKDDVLLKRFGIDNAAAEKILNSRSPWKDFFNKLDVYGVPLRAEINTRTARFSRTPCYSVSFRIQPVDTSSPAGALEICRQASLKTALSALTTIVNPTPTGFEIQFLSAVSAKKDAKEEELEGYIQAQAEFAKSLLPKNTTIVWMGIE